MGRLSTETLIDNGKNYLYNKLLFSTKAYKNSLSWNSRFYTYFTLSLIYIRNVLLWPANLVYSLLIKGKLKKNSNITAYWEYERLYPVQRFCLLFTLCIGLYLYFISASAKQLLSYRIILYFFSLSVLLDLILITIAAGSIINRYKSSLVSIKYNVVTSYLILTANVFLFSFLLSTTLPLKMGDLELLNAIKNELFGINALNTLIGGEVNKIKELSTWFYLLGAAGLFLKFGVINQFIKAWKTKEDENDLFSIVKSLLYIQQYNKAYRIISYIPYDFIIKNNVNILLLTYAGNGMWQEIKIEIEKSVKNKLSTSFDQGFFSLVTEAWQFDFDKDKLLEMYDLWLNSLQSEGYFCNAIELGFGNDFDRIEKLQKLIEKNGLTEYMPLAIFILTELLNKSLSEEDEAKNIDGVAKYINDPGVSIEKITALQFYLSFQLYKKRSICLRFTLVN